MALKVDLHNECATVKASAENACPHCHLKAKTSLLKKNVDRPPFKLTGG